MLLLLQSASRLIVAFEEKYLRTLEGKCHFYNLLKLCDITTNLEVVPTVLAKLKPFLKVPEPGSHGEEQAMWLSTYMLESIDKQIASGQVLKKMPGAKRAIPGENDQYINQQFAIPPGVLAQVRAEAAAGAREEYRGTLDGMVKINVANAEADASRAAAELENSKAKKRLVDTST